MQASSTLVMLGFSAKLEVCIGYKMPRFLILPTVLEHNTKAKNKFQVLINSVSGPKTCYKTTIQTPNSNLRIEKFLGHVTKGHMAMGPQ